MYYNEPINTKIITWGLMQPGPEVINLFMLNSTEHDKYNILASESKTVFIFEHFRFYEHSCSVELSTKTVVSPRGQASRYKTFYTQLYVLYTVEISRCAQLESTIFKRTVLLHTGQCKRTGGCHNELVVAIFRTVAGVKGKKNIYLLTL